MAKQNNNRFRLMCMGVIAFTAVSAIIFAALGGGEGISSNGEELVEGFNSELPSANVESVSDDRVTAARREDERRKKEEMLGITGSHFNLLEIEEKKKKEEDIDSLAKVMQEQTRADLENQIKIQEAQAGVVYNAPDISTREDQTRKREERRRQVYKDAQDIFGKDVLPDQEKQEDVKEEKVIAEVTKSEPPKKRNGFNTMNNKNGQISGNSIRAVVHGTHSNLTTNSPVKLRLLDPLKVGDITVPRNSFVYGKVSFSDSRVMIQVDNVKYQNNVLPFKGEIFDNDGSRGIYVPDNAVNDAVKEAEKGAVNETPSVRGGGGTLTSLALNLTNKTVGTIKNAVVNRVGKNKVSISENYMVTIRTMEK
ncbi:MAG: conjugative transposon protein TraM [Lachnospiraceae bacterium]|nr:conjugative transposon protein TraM [Lachnospiraceae bacterium]